jgi:integrase
MTKEDTSHEPELVGEIVRIFRRGRVWWANYQLGGCQHRRTLKTSSKKEARRRALVLEAELLAGRHQARPKAPPAVDSVIEEYLRYLRTERRAPKTLAKYEKVLDRLGSLLRARRAATILDLNLQAVDAYRHERVAAKAAPKTVYTETVIVRQLVNFALSRGLIADDPLRGYKIREPKPTPQPCWSAEEVEKILASCPESHQAALTLLADSGMRVAELSYLTWADVDFGRNVLHVRPKDDWQPKTGDQRAIPMSPRARSLLEHLPRRCRWAVTAPPSPRFPRGDHQVSERRLLTALKRVLRGLGLAGHLHTFRHAFISRSLTAGIPEAVVREWVGHVDRDILRLYTHIASVDSQAAMRRLTDELARSKVGEEERREAEKGHEAGSAQFQHKTQEVKNDRDAK